MTYEHMCKACKHEWEDWYGINDPTPTLCPNCKVEGQVERLISGGAGRGIVPLTGNELKEKINQDAASMVRESGKNESMLANLVGDNKYHNNELLRDGLRKEKW